MAALWRTLARAGADVVLAGHDHHYERFAPIDGIRSFVVGTGGRSHYPVLWRVRAEPGRERHDVRRAPADAPRGPLRLALPPGRGLELQRPRHGPLPLDAEQVPACALRRAREPECPEVR